ncbi:Sec7-domain-containing protein [Tuber magnatum]|uniref:Sec7-domain-containing protein n=1 Tax=Tuber magnatum TaxID=42249 RepID=A0A317T1H0_9PEZI|nr:Sec7-domain-containing protein [Tuber magnatum]
MEEEELPTPSTPQRISVAINPIALVTTECISVTSAMRKNARWAQSAVSVILGGGGGNVVSGGSGSATGSGLSTPVPGSPARGLQRRRLGGEEVGLDMGLTSRWGLRGKRGKSIQDNPLMAAFAKLRSDLQDCKDIRKFDTPSLLHPFLQVIRSSSTSGPITSLALIAVTKFFAYGLINRDSPRLSLAMQLLSSAITHCRFEASDSAQDEVVLLRILKLMEMMISGPGGELLGDESVCEMMETGLSMCCQMRLSEMLRRSAEMSMVFMCQVVFERLKHLEIEADVLGGDLEESSRGEMESVKMEPSQEVKPYSLPSIRELLRVLVELLDPHNKTHTDTMRVMAMRIIDVAFEVAGPSIAKHPSLASLAKDDLCRYLFQLVRSDTMAILQESLRVTGTLLATTRGVLKLQQELFLSYERQKLGMEGGSRRPDAREAMVESVGALARIPSFMVELYVNYDCEVDRSDLCEDVVGFLSRNAFPDSATWSTTNVPPLCLDALLGYIGFISERLNHELVTEGYPDPETLQKQRARKQIIINGANKFNEDPKKGIQYLVSESIIDRADNPDSIARFLKGTSRINKKLLGEYLSKKSNMDILTVFMEMFDFSGKRVDEALRDMLETFRLPGESALIERIVTVFSEKYCSGVKPDDVEDKDAVFVLSYAIIMLNTDQHNPNLKSQARMKYEDFARNLRGVNGGKNFEPAYLQAIFDTIKNNEIILPEEHDNKHAFDYAWRELLLKTMSAGDLVICDTNIYDADMFAATWKPIIATLSYVFLSATDDAVFSRVIAGFDQCARIAAKYGLTEALDHIVRCLGTISTLSTETPPSTALNTEIQVNNNSVMVSELAVKFGRDFKAQLATVVLFRVVTSNEKVLSEGWKQIVRIWLNLFVNSLIPPFFSQSESGLDIPSIPLQTPSVVIERSQTSKEAGLFSALSSYLSSYASDEPPEPSDEELDSTLCTVDCINACYLGDIFADIMQLDATSLGSLVTALISQLPNFDEDEDDSTNIVIVKPDYPLQSPNGSNTVKKGPIYDPAVVYVLELATCLVLRDEETVAEHGKMLAETLTNIIRNAGLTHQIVVSRVIYYLFSLLQASHDRSFLNVPVLLHSIATLDKGLLAKSASPVVRGLSKCVKSASSSLKTEMVNSPDFWVLLRVLLPNADASAEAFSVMELITSESPYVTSDNYSPVVSLLNDFASAGSVGSTFEQKQDKLPKRGKARKIIDRPDAEIVARGSRAVLMVYQLTPRVPNLIKQSHLEKKEAWTTYWSPILESLSTQCINPCREIRNQAFSSLQPSLLSPDLTSDDHHEWTAIFGDVLFPLINRLLKPEVFQSDPRGMSDTRVQAATLLCKVFLHYLVMLSEWDGMLDLWLKILDIMDRLMNSGQGDHLEEAVPESLKNILLVMASGKYLVPPEEDGGNAELWKLTWNRLERFLPDLREELFRAPSPPPELGDAATRTGERRAEEGREEAKPRSLEEAEITVATTTLEVID